MSDTDLNESTTRPDEVFNVLGNQTRIQIIQTLGEADKPLNFKELRGRVGHDDPGNFNYHLGKLKGHFVRETEDGYELRKAGERVIQAVLSGVVTEAPVLERTQIDESCQLCGAPIEVQFSEERVEAFCTECGGMWEKNGSVEEGYLGAKLLPPAGLRDRTRDEMYQVAWSWTNLKFFAMASDFCPQCSAPLEKSIDICENHDTSNGLCSNCQRRSAVRIHFQCTNCIFDQSGTFPIYITTNTHLLAFLTTHGFNPISPESTAEVQQIVSNYDEEILSTNPFKARLTFSIDDDHLILTVDDNLSVVESQEHHKARIAED